jgi:hypothetical protein
MRHEMPYPAQYELMWYLSFQGPSTAAELSEKQRHSLMPRTPQEVASMLSSMVKRGWVDVSDTAPSIYALSQRTRDVMSW